MSNVIDFMLTNDYFSIGLLILLIILIIAFFVVLFSGKTKSIKKDKVLDGRFENEAIEANVDNTNFDHNEYVKETTAEFELAPVSEVMPNTSDDIPVVTEESQALKVETPADAPLLKDFSFDELSKSISEELDKLKDEEESKIEEKKEVFSIPGVATPSFSNEVKEVNVTNLDEIEKVEFPANYIRTYKVDENNHETEDVKEFITDFDVSKIDLPSSKPVEQDLFKDASKEAEPVLKDEEVPLFARFNTETYDINKKD